MCVCFKSHSPNTNTFSPEFILLKYVLFILPRESEEQRKRSRTDRGSRRPITGNIKRRKREKLYLGIDVNLRGTVSERYLEEEGEME